MGKLRKVTVEFRVDEDIVKDVAEIEELDQAVGQELGWLAASGFSVVDVKIEEE